MPELEKQFVHDAFEHPDLVVITDPIDLKSKLESCPSKNTVLLMMSSGKFGKINLIEEITKITS